MVGNQAEGADGARLVNRPVIILFVELTGARNENCSLVPSRTLITSGTEIGGTPGLQTPIQFAGILPASVKYT